MTAGVTPRRGDAAHPAVPREWTYRVVNVFPHDSDAYTQGLIYRGGFLFESTGLNGRSTLRKSDWRPATSSSRWRLIARTSPRG
jgi:glutamine cyclotransferase